MATCRNCSDVNPQSMRLLTDANYYEWSLKHSRGIFDEVLRWANKINVKCTDSSCPEMTAGPKYKYLWPNQLYISSEKNEQYLKLSAPKYIHKLIEWTNNQLSPSFVSGSSPKISKWQLITNGYIKHNSEDIAIPSEIHAIIFNYFVEVSRDTLKDVFKRLFRVYAHIYHHHVDCITAQKQNGSICKEFENDLKHLVYFTQSIMCHKIANRQFAPLNALIKNITTGDRVKTHGMKRQYRYTGNCCNCDFCVSNNE